MQERKGGGSQPPLMALNHVSRLCRNVKESTEFYTKVLGFELVERPPALDFEGAWLFNYGIGIHLVQSKDEDRLPSDTDHLDRSFQNDASQHRINTYCVCICHSLTWNIKGFNLIRIRKRETVISITFKLIKYNVFPAIGNKLKKGNYQNLNFFLSKCHFRH